MYHRHDYRLDCKYERGVIWLPWSGLVHSDLVYVAILFTTHQFPVVEASKQSMHGEHKTFCLQGLQWAPFHKPT